MAIRRLAWCTCRHAHVISGCLIAWERASGRHVYRNLHPPAALLRDSSSLGVLAPQGSQRQCNSAERDHASRRRLRPAPSVEERASAKRATPHRRVTGAPVVRLTREPWPVHQRDSSGSPPSRSVASARWEMAFQLGRGRASKAYHGSWPRQHPEAGAMRRAGPAECGVYHAGEQIRSRCSAAQQCAKSNRLSVGMSSGTPGAAWKRPGKLLASAIKIRECRGPSCERNAVTRATLPPSLKLALRVHVAPATTGSQAATGSPHVVHVPAAAI
jgi:hypothetical protein